MCTIQVVCATYVPEYAFYTIEFDGNRGCLKIKKKHSKQEPITILLKCIKSIHIINWRRGHIQTQKVYKHTHARALPFDSAALALVLSLSHSRIHVFDFVFFLLYNVCTVTCWTTTTKIYTHIHEPKNRVKWMKTSKQCLECKQTQWGHSYKKKIYPGKVRSV